MMIPGHMTALEPIDVKRYPTDVASIPNRGTAAAEPDQGLSFPEVAARVADEHASDIEANPPITKPEKHLALWEKDEFSFRDVIDIINPLQHIPIVATLYRHMTGEKIGAVPRVIGGALWGRLGGFVSGVVNAVVDWLTGKDIGDHIYAALFGDKGESDNDSAVAQTPGRSLMSPAALPAAQETAAAPPGMSPATVLKTDSPKDPAQSSNTKQVPPLSSVVPTLMPDVIGQALLSSYLRGQREDSDEESRRLYLRV